MTTQAAGHKGPGMVTAGMLVVFVFGVIVGSPIIAILFGLGAGISLCVALVTHLRRKRRDE